MTTSTTAAATQQSATAAPPATLTDDGGNSELVNAAVHATAGSLGGVLSMSLLYPLENIRTRMQVQNKVAVVSRIQSRRASRAASRASSRMTTPPSSPPAGEADDHGFADNDDGSGSRHSSAGHERLTNELVLQHLEQQREEMDEQRKSGGDAAMERDDGTKELELDEAVAATGVDVDESDFAEDEDEEEVVFRGPIHCAQWVIRNEGVSGLYRGLKSTLFGVAVSSSVYFFWYNLFKQALTRGYGLRTLGPLQNMAVASVAGAVNCFVTVPIWVVATRLTLQRDKDARRPAASPTSVASTQVEHRYNGIFDALATILREEGIKGLYQGLVPALLLVSNPCIQFMVYEQLTAYVQFVRRYRVQRYMARTGKVLSFKQQEHLGRADTREIFLLGAVAKAIATVATYPYQVIKSRMQLKNNPYKSTMHAFRRIIREEGVGALFQGMRAKMFQTVLNSAFMFVFYEHLVRLVSSLIRVLRRRP
eukprot:TRINITY_DN76261_c0_g1_i1.p1 TRINITY_DN76261_c0_g1~~TRINITY_DN76261_c0_g1_i1.p1  ORF type:complete len:497 (-),score=229.84 TRINITY_DN76261_c0_g1_i1:64-1503(-)